MLCLSIPANAEPTAYLNVTVDYIKLQDGKAEKQAIEGVAVDNESVEVEVQRCRLLTVDIVKKAMTLVKQNKLEEAQKLIEHLIANINDGCSEKAKKDPRLAALMEDLTGQVTEAFSKLDFYKKWGEHYLPSLMRAHQLQQCNNFKDPGLQHYGGKLFRSLRDEVDDIFVKLPPPQPTFPIDNTGGYRRGHGGVAHVSRPVASMNVYHMASNPCFDGECLIAMADGSHKPVKSIKKGDRIATHSHNNNHNNNSAEVQCVVKTLCAEGKTLLVELEGGLRVTPYHPVRQSGSSRWHFPCTIGEVRERECPAVYSFVLQTHHVMVIDGVECVTLGHGFEEDEVVRHPYFGTSRVIEDLQRLPGWAAGLIELRSGCLLRDAVSGLVCGLVVDSQKFTTQTQEGSNLTNPHCIF